MSIKMILSASALTLAAVTSMFTQATNVNWGYFQHGDEEVILPAQWGDFFPACNGFEQSPIDIQNTTEENRGEFKFDYENTPLHVLNNGHTIEVEYEPGSSMTIDGDEYRLLQFHFHTPSEHLVNGNNFPMEMHLVHANTSGELAVVGVLIKDGKSNKIFEKIISNAPAQAGTNEVDDEEINAANLLPGNTSEYFNYAGSLTTPPCNEGVRWFVMKKSIEFSESQIEYFEHIIHLNARPAQEVNARTIYKNDD